MRNAKSNLSTGSELIRESSLTRRGILCGIAAISLGFIPEPAEAAKGVTILASGKVEVLLASNPTLKKVGGLIQVDFTNGLSVAVVRVSKAASGFKVLNLACTHQGVPLKQSGNTWTCPAHNSQFSIDGKLKRGPAQSALQEIPFKATAKTLLIG